MRVESSYDQEKSMADIQGPQIAVRLLGRAAELVSTQSPVANLQVRLPGNIQVITPAEIIKLVADQNVLLRNQIIRDDGMPRSSTKILLNGVAPKNLNQQLRLEKRVVRDVVSDTGQTSGGDPIQPLERIVVVIVDIDLGVVDILVVIIVPCDG
jgi:hypothetical protein